MSISRADQDFKGANPHSEPWPSATIRAAWFLMQAAAVRDTVGYRNCSSSHHWFEIICLMQSAR